MAQNDLNSMIEHANFENPDQFHLANNQDDPQKTSKCTLNDILLRRCNFKKSLQTTLSQIGQPIPKTILDF